eukprot:6491036-Amphidinium_carterae.2
MTSTSRYRERSRSDRLHCGAIRRLALTAGPGMVILYPRAHDQPPHQSRARAPKTCNAETPQSEAQYSTPSADGPSLEH